jgi:hypothetical protein
MAPRLARAAIGLMALASAGAASAAVTEYTDQTAFDAAASNTSSFNFNGLSAPGSLTLGDLSSDNLSFSASGSNVPVLWGGGLFYGGSSFFSSVSLAPGLDPAELLCTLAGATAIGFIYGDFADEGALPFTVTLSSGETFSLSTPALAGVDTGFVGFISNQPITSVTFSDEGQAFDLIQVERSPGSVVGAPEPGPLSLMAAGLLALAALARRRTPPVRRVIRVLRRAARD